MTTTDTTEESIHELLGMLPLINRIVAAEVRREAGEETTMPQYRVLSHLANEPTTLSMLARKRHVSLQSMGELIQVLVERGWVVRTPDPNDRRQHLLSLTEHGRRHYERAERRMQERLDPVIKRLTASELAAVRLALPALRRVLTEHEGIDADGNETL